MKVTVLGLWHLGSVTAASCAKHFDVTGLDFDEEVILSLKLGKLPVFEPGLEELFAQGLKDGRLKLTSDAVAACRNAAVLWVAYDTPVDDDDRSDPEFVLERVRAAIRLLPRDALVLLSSQMPTGFCRKLEAEFPGRRIACSPENLRLGRALGDFNNPGRVVAGCRTSEDRDLLVQLFRPFCSNMIWMSPESAEMCKHALNSFLAVSITFANEIARLCELTGASAKEVETGLKSDERIGSGAYLSPGAAFAGGTLARDVVALTEIAKNSGEMLELIPAIKRSNDRHKEWALNRLQDRFGDLRRRVIGVLGLTYKPGTDTLRRSQAVELCRVLVSEGCEVRAFDPQVRKLPDSLSAVELSSDAAGAIRGTDAIVICTEWPEFLSLPWAHLIGEMRQACIYDATGFVKRSLGAGANLSYYSVGSPK